MEAFRLALVIQELKFFNEFDKEPMSQAESAACDPTLMDDTNRDDEFAEITPVFIW
jgi:hypothetical protein